MIDPENGLQCENNQNDPNCENYEVRFCCPGKLIKFYKTLTTLTIQGDVCTLSLHNCHADADCTTTDSNADGFTCSCKDGFTNTPHKADGEVCYDKRKRFSKIKSKS